MTPSPGVLALRRAFLVAAAGLAASAVLGGLARLGFSVGTPTLAALHGPLFVTGVFATIIALERAVALGSAWAYAAPALGAVGAFAAVWAPQGVGAALTLGGAVALAATNAAIVRKQSEPFTWLMLLGSLVLAGAAGRSLAGAAPSQVATAWLAFFVLTITAERLELSRMAPVPTWARRALVVLAVALAVTSLAGAERLAGGAMALLGAWELRFDLARRTLRQKGLPRYAAIGVLVGAAWLVMGGSMLVARDALVGFTYDAPLHAVFVGFVLSMVFAHAPIILPSVARVAVPFHPVLYVPLAALHASLALRLAGDLLPDADLRRLGGLGNALSLALFLLAVLASRALARRPTRIRED